MATSVASPIDRTWTVPGASISSGILTSLLLVGWGDGRHRLRAGGGSPRAHADDAADDGDVLGRLRGTGAGFCFNLGRYVAAIGPFVIGGIAARGANALDAAMIPLF